MTILTVNSGSTSVKLALYAPDPAGAPVQLASAHYAGQGLEPQATLRAFAARVAAPPEVIAHRIVHGGTQLVQPVQLDRAAIAAIEALSPLAPLHNPVALRWVSAATQVWGANVRQVATFDTAFFAALPRVAAEYALPARLGLERGVRRYGFHGLAHEAMWRRWCELQPQLPRGGRLITLQLGGGCSIAAIERGQPLDTSMGFSPLEGLVMATRCGDLDAAVVPYLERQLGLPGDEIVAQLNETAGLAGLSGGSANPTELLADLAAPSQFAIELYCYRLRKYVGAYLAVLGGCDGIVFGGGVGEHVPGVRARALARLEWCGIVLDEARNAAARGGEAAIDAPSAAVRVQVVAVDEEQGLARAALPFLSR